MARKSAIQTQALAAMVRQRLIEMNAAIWKLHPRPCLWFQLTKLADEADILFINMNLSAKITRLIIKSNVLYLAFIRRSRRDARDGITIIFLWGFKAE